MSLTERAKLLAAFLKHVGGFKVSDFQHRLILQKKMYLLQAFGLSLGYRFSWYLHGPYSPDLTKDAFSVAESGQYHAIAPFQFEADGAKAAIDHFQRVVGPHLRDERWLEVAASIHLLKTYYSDLSRARIFERVQQKKVAFKEEECEKVWDELVAGGLLS